MQVTDNFLFWISGWKQETMDTKSFVNHHRECGLKKQCLTKWQSDRGSNPGPTDSKFNALTNLIRRFKHQNGAHNLMNNLYNSTVYGCIHMYYAYLQITFHYPKHWGRPHAVEGIGIQVEVNTGAGYKQEQYSPDREILPTFRHPARLYVGLVF